jgi:Fic family protein/DNA-binding XRE family transcriptional regulator
MTKFVMYNFVIMKVLLREARINKGLTMTELAALLGIDQALVSRFESGKRLPTKMQVKQISLELEIPFKAIQVAWLKEKMYQEFHAEPFALDALQIVQEEIQEYRNTQKADHSSDLTSLLREIDLLKSKLDNLRHFDSYRITQALELEYTFESNRIEGNTLTLRETDLIINEGLTISGKSMREHLEAINHSDAIEYMKEMVSRSSDVNERELLTLHNLVLRGIEPREAGRYRSVQVMIKGSAHMPPQPYMVKKLMGDYFLWYEQQKNILHPVILAAEIHERLVTIHPFIDGNGRTSRLIMNMILLKHGFVIANIKGDNAARMKYYESLETVQTKSSKEAFLLFVATVEKECLERYLSILE